MVSNFAWFARRSGPPNERWEFLNSLGDLRKATQAAFEAQDPVYFEFGPVILQGACTPVVSLPLGLTNSLPQIFQKLDVWMNHRLGGPLYVYGARNLFDPLIHHYQKSRGGAGTLPAYDLLETLVLPGAIPTVGDRTSCDRNFANWLTGQPMLTPFEFWQHLTHTND